MNVASLLQDSPSERRASKADGRSWPNQPQPPKPPPPAQQPTWPAQQPPYPPPYSRPPAYSEPPPMSGLRQPPPPPPRDYPQHSWQGGPPQQPQPPPPQSQQTQRTFQGQFHTSFVPAREASPPPRKGHNSSGSVPNNNNNNANAPNRRDWIPEPADWEPTPAPRAPPPVQEPPERVFRARRTISLGTFVLPHTPFPYTFPDDPEPKPKAEDTNDPELLSLETRATILLPSAHLPAARPTRAPKIWGGGLPGPLYPPAADPLRRNEHERHLSGSSHPHPYELLPNGTQQQDQRRRLYTDDSDVLGAAVHGGHLRWSHVARARKEGRDVRLELRLVRVLGTGVGTAEEFEVGNGEEKEKVRGRKEGKDAVAAPKDATKEGGDAPSKDESSKEKEKEIVQTDAPVTEAIGRFLGGWGARCMRTWEDVLLLPPTSQSAAAAAPGKEKEKNAKEKEAVVDGKEEGELVEEPEALLPPAPAEGARPEVAPEEQRGEAKPEIADNPLDDGRAVMSAGWGAGHAGSAFEVLGAWVAEKNAAHALTRANRGQRLREYAARRAVLVGSVPCKPVAGRKRRMRWPAPHAPVSSPNGRILSGIVEETALEVDDDMSMDADADAEKRLGWKWGWAVTGDRDREAVRGRTIVCGFGFGAGAGAGKLGFKYEPGALRGVLFPPPSATGDEADDGEAQAGPDGDDEGGRARKRRRVSGLEDVIAAAAMEGADADAKARSGEAEMMAVDKPERATENAAEDVVEPPAVTTKAETGSIKPEQAPQPPPPPATKQKQKQKQKAHNVLLETADGAYVFAPAAEGTAWDISRAGEELYRGLGAEDVEFGAEGVRFRAKSNSEGDTKTQIGAEEWGAWVGVGLWRYV